MNLKNYKKEGRKSKAAVFKNQKKIIFENKNIHDPQDYQILIRMEMCGICQYDIKCFSGKQEDSRYASAPGHEGVGIVEVVGDRVKSIKKGNRVATVEFGAFSEFYIADSRKAAKIPEDTDDLEIWIAEPIACIVNALRLAKVEPGDNVVVIGCGYMGLLIIQGLPKEFLPNLVAIDINDYRLSLAKKFGAIYTINSLIDDPVQAVLDIVQGGVDIVIEAAGVTATLDYATKMLKTGGRLCIFGHHANFVKINTGIWHMKGLEVLNTTPFLSKDFGKDLSNAVDLIKRKIFNQKELITNRYKFFDLQKALEETSKNQGETLKAVIINNNFP